MTVILYLLRYQNNIFSSRFFSRHEKKTEKKNRGVWDGDFKTLLFTVINIQYK